LKHSPIFAIHEIKRTLSNQIHRHKSISEVTFTTSKVILKHLK